MSEDLFHSIETKDTTREVSRPINTMDIIAQVSAMPSDAGDRVALMEKLIAMKYADEDRQARLAFETAFAKMRRELPSIKKTKEVTRSGGQHMYNYAPLEEIQKTCDPILQAHGFSYSWREEAIESGKRVWFDLFGFGHTKSNCFDAPLLGAKQSNSGGEIVNAVQAARMTSSYAKRNSMVDGLGLIIEDEDTDATLEIDDELKNTLADIQSSLTIDDLLATNKRAMAKYANNPNAITFILGTYAQARKRLTGGPQ
jgi:hypothetical protein